MSGNIVPIIAATAGATAAAAAARKRREEEEKMTTYKSDDLDGWEFKIVRANTRKFKNREKIEQVRQDEAKAGWELVEKFDDSRLRFKRRVEKRSFDAHTEIDPYRTQVGSDKGVIIATIIGVLVLLLGILAFIGFRFGFDRGVIGGLTMPALIAVTIVFFGIITAIIAVRKHN